MNFYEVLSSGCDYVIGMVQANNICEALDRGMRLAGYPTNGVRVKRRGMPGYHTKYFVLYFTNNLSTEPVALSPDKAEMEEAVRTVAGLAVSVKAHYLEWNNEKY